MAAFSIPLTVKRSAFTCWTLCLLKLTIVLYMCILWLLQLPELFEIVDKYVDKQRKGAKNNCLMFVENEAQCFGFIVDLLLPELCNGLTNAIIVYLHDVYNICYFFILVCGNSLHNKSQWSNIWAVPLSVLLLILLNVSIYTYCTSLCYLKSVYIDNDKILEIFSDTSKESLSKGAQCKETQKP